MITGLSFASIAVRDLQQATDQYCLLFGLEVMQPPNDYTRLGFRNTFLGNGQQVMIELIEPLGPDSPITKFLDSRGEGLYLITFEVDDLPQAVKDVRVGGGHITGIPEGQEPRPNTDMVWVHPKSAHGVFIELLQKGFGPLPGRGLRP